MITNDTIYLLTLLALILLDSAFLVSLYQAIWRVIWKILLNQLKNAVTALNIHTYILLIYVYKKHDKEKTENIKISRGEVLFILNTQNYIFVLNIVFLIHYLFWNKNLLKHSSDVLNIVKEKPLCQYDLINHWLNDCNASFT